MRTLVLIRHAKSSWKQDALDDLERPLNGRGERDAPRMARLVAARGPADALISSPAARARTTAAHFAHALGRTPESVQVDERLYLAGVGELLALSRGLDDEHARVMLFGHNPGFTELANALGNRAIHNVPTCGVVELAFDTSAWADLAPTTLRAMRFDTPGQLDARF